MVLTLFSVSRETNNFFRLHAVGEIKSFSVQQFFKNAAGEF